MESKVTTALFDTNIHYLTSFRPILSRAKDTADALQFFKELYPDHQGELLFARTVEHWIDSAASESNHLSISNIQDLTHALTSNFPFIPVPGVTSLFKINPIAKMEDHGVRANKWIIHEHIGTQVDAPNHFARDGISMEEVKVENLIVPVVVIDISERVRRILTPC